MSLALNLADWERLAEAKLPEAVWSYYAGGSEDERTVADNRAAFGRLRLRPRVLVDVSRIDLTTKVLGREVAAPILVAPTAYQAMAHPEGERATARASATAGTVMCVSTMANVSLEEVAAAAPGGRRWFQLYVFKERAVSEALVRRAEAAGYEALVLTVDTPRLGRRERDVRLGFGLPTGLGLANFEGALSREPAREPGESGIAHYAAVHLDDSLTWDAVTWLRGLTRMKLVLKGIVTGEDAARARACGVDAIVVSNHGGRQLDGAIATIDALPEVVAAAPGIEVYLDGGVRRGTDVLKALALGARAVLLGRPVLWGLAVDGERGVGQVLSLLRAELELALALSGRASVAAIDRSLLV